jgi:hypothetical protein
MTIVAHNKSKQHSFNANVNFSFMLPYAWCSLLWLSKLTLQICFQPPNMLANFSQEATNMHHHTWTKHGKTCSLTAWNMVPTCSILDPRMLLIATQNKWNKLTILSWHLTKKLTFLAFLSSLNMLLTLYQPVYNRLLTGEMSTCSSHNMLNPASKVLLT